MTPKRSSKKSQPDLSDESKVPPGDQQGTHDQQDNQPDNSDASFPVVGIGASAGGLEAFTQLLNCLPTDTGMACVMIQHMAAEQESVLSTVLSRSTKMPVHEAEDGMAIALNQVYVIPPNVSMTITQGKLQLTPRPRTNALFMSVDTFLLSLAAERGNKGIAVILSGADSDGTRGLEAIKAAGGITFAQCQETAQVQSMPNTAIATGQVDFILSPTKLLEN
jgi:two-component system, chemotaxis family, CheB/CheR fusion protein